MRRPPRASWIVLAALVISVGASCRSAPDEDQVERNRELVGSWTQIIEEASGPRATTTRHFFLDPDGFLKVGFAELGPQSRVALIPDDVEYDGTSIRWKEGGSSFRGSVAAGKDAISLRYGSGDPPTAYSFVRYPEGDRLWRDLMAAVDAELDYVAPEATDDGWACAALDSVGIDRDAILALIHRIVDGEYDDLHGMLLVKEDALVLEEYFADRGRMHGSALRRIFRDKLHHLGSTTKSVTSLLIGIAIDKGMIESVDVPVFDFFPEYEQLRTSEKDRILLRHLLTMTAGLEWEQFRYDCSDPRNDGARMWRVGDVLEYTLSKPCVAVPGEEFEYSNGVSTLLGGVLRNATGMEADAFAEEHVFRKLGISDYEWTRYPDGSLETDGGLALRLRDLAKIGRLFLDGGEWEGDRVVSREWVEASTGRQIKLRGQGAGYGYKWQQMSLEYDDGTISYYFMPGYGGNILAVFPALDLVVAFTGANYDWDVRSVYREMLQDRLIPALR
jgi:CubicO group peptidase (beta-lactamase class C family)